MRKYTSFFFECQLLRRIQTSIVRLIWEYNGHQFKPCQIYTTFKFLREFPVCVYFYLNRNSNSIQSLSALSCMEHIHRSKSVQMKSACLIDGSYCKLRRDWVNDILTSQITNGDVIAPILPAADELPTPMFLLIRKKKHLPSLHTLEH